MAGDRIGRRGFMKAAGAGLCAAMGAAGLRTARAGARAPNIVFILIDDLGWADLGCYGNAFHETTHIDRLASEGMRFTDAYAAAPVCSPTRASIMTGQYPARLGITDFIAGHSRPWAKLTNPRNRQQYLPLEAVTMAEALKPAGYVTGAFGKWHLGGREYFPDHQGFDEMVVSDGRHFAFSTTPPTERAEDEYLADFLTRQAVQFMETHQDEPFLLFLSHYAVHIPLEARAELVSKYEAKPKPSGGVNNPVYAAMVEHVDQSVGRVLDTLEALGLAEDTVVVFMSDNGGLYLRYDGDGPLVTTNTPLRDEKGSLYEGGIRVPMIMRWPGVVAPGATCAAPVSSIDFYPTFLEIAGAPAPAGHPIDGVSLTPLLAARGGLPRSDVFWHYPHYHHSTPASALRDGDWKLLEFFEDGRLELYNLREDISESRDLAAAEPDRAAAMHARLVQWRESLQAVMPEPNPDFDPERAGEWAGATRPAPAPRP